MHPEPILLINMPFGPLNTPSLGLSLLKSGLSQRGISSRILYLNIAFANLIGEEPYRLISQGFPRNVDQIGEWIFSKNLFPDHQKNDFEFIGEIIQGNNKYHSKEFYLSTYDLETFIQDVSWARKQVDGFLNDCLKIVLEHNPKVIGFTSIFQQHFASLALAQAIKKEKQETLIVFGGANCEGLMGSESVQQFDFIDVVVSGEGDRVFPDLAEEYLQTGNLIKVPGVFSKQFDFTIQNTALVHSMDEVAVPDFFDFFETYLDSDFEHPPKLLLETSRGCWWGQKKHCTFCGLNGGTMAFRSKSEERVINEFQLMKEHFPGASIAVVDNILDMKYFKNVLPRLVEEKLDLNLFFEVKANLKKDQVQLLKQAGINTIQPGIESLSDNILTTMNKGVKAIQNIQLLKWCKELGVDPFWNLIWGFPDEQEEDYQEMIDLIPLISHLKPPVGFATLRLDRFSPNFNQAESLGFENVQPYPSYDYLYPFADEVKANLAYFFSSDMDKPFDFRTIQGEIIEKIQQWKSAYSETDLFTVDKEDALLIWDFRPAAQENYYIFEGVERVVYLICDIMKTKKQLLSILAQSFEMEISLDHLDQILSRFINLGLMLCSENNYLSLAVPTENYIPDVPILEKLENWV